MRRGAENVLICLFFFYYFFHSSEEWEKLDADGRKKLGLDFDDDGEFWLVCYA